VTCWQFSDALFATAVPMCADEPRELYDVLAAADAINHLILTRDEIEQAVRRLNGADLLHADRCTFRLTDTGHDLLNRRRGWTVRAQVRSTRRLLDEIPVREIEWHIWDSEFVNAVAEYLRRLERR
jgi:hypothetical protein